MSEKPTSKVRIKKLPFKTEKVVVRGQTLIMLADIPAGEADRSRNVFGMTRDGTLLWRVDAPPAKEERITPFVDVWLDEKGGVMGRILGGKLFHVDVTTGKLKPA